MTPNAMVSIDDWQALVNKPVFTADGKDVGVVSEVQPEKLVVTFGPITPDKYLISKSSIEGIDKGVAYLGEKGSDVEHNYKFE